MQLTLRKEDHMDTENKKMRILSDNNRKASGDSNMKTSANTPKSEQLNIVTIDIEDNDSKCRSEEVKVKALSSFFPKFELDRSPMPPKLSNLNECMLKLQESKDHIANRSPMPPMYALLKRDSSIGENPFGNIPTPNRVETQAYPIIYGLCKNHCSQAGILHIVGDDESISDHEPEPMIVREFSVDQLEDMSDVQSNCSKKIHNNPFVE